MESDGVARFDLVVPAEWNERNDVAHGGWVISVLSELVGHALVLSGGLGLLGTLNVRWAKSVPVGEVLHGAARVSGRERRKVFVSAELASPSVGGLATASAILIAAPTCTHRVCRTALGDGLESAASEVRFFGILCNNTCNTQTEQCGWIRANSEILHAANHGPDLGQGQRSKRSDNVDYSNLIDHLELPSRSEGEGRDRCRASVETMRAAFPDFRNTSTSSLVTEDLAVSYGGMTRKPTQRLMGIPRRARASMYHVRYCVGRIDDERWTSPTS